MSASDTPAPATGEGNGHAAPDGARKGHDSFVMLALGSVGVVFGDIGTSPLYAFREALAAASSDGINRSEIVGIISLMLWTLTIVVTLKYVVFLMRADNKGEGGTLSLMALVSKAYGRRTFPVFLLGIAGASLFYGDAVITPAISVLSAVEGLKLVTEAFEPLVLPLSLAILIGLFMVQSRGTGAVAVWFGPITLVWFLAMAACGLLHIADDADIFWAFNPANAAIFLATHGLEGFFVLGAVFLTVTGAEALYADMGHFGKGPIRSAWGFVVFPALALNYLGQGALVLARPEAAANPFFLMAPDWALVPLVILATMATVIASQAVITGAFSYSQQAIQLGLLPRMEITRTSETQAGQIYLPQINMLLVAGVVLFVLTFRSSSALAHAYGIAVTATMLVDTALAFLFVRKVWRLGLGLSMLLIAPFFVIDASFFTANLLKILHGGYVPVLLAAFLMVVMWTWRRGQKIVFAKTKNESVRLEDLLELLRSRPPVRVKGTAVFLTNDPEIAPPALFHNLKHNKVLHEQLVMMSVFTQNAPRVEDGKRVKLETVAPGVIRVIANYGFMEQPNVPRALARARKQGLKFDIMTTSFFLGRRTIVPAANSGMPLWQDHLFIWLTRNAESATEFFGIPSGRVVELGTQVTV
jgi:KUP system potassium uptake protein